MIFQPQSLMIPCPYRRLVPQPLGPASVSVIHVGTSVRAALTEWFAFFARPIEKATPARRLSSVVSAPPRPGGTASPNRRAGSQLRTRWLGSES